MPGRSSRLVRHVLLGLQQSVKLAANEKLDI
jgi:hypothetical protein